MADIINFTGKKNKNWLNQYSATSGSIPSAAVIDQMIQAELDAAYKNRYYSGALQLQQNKLDQDAKYQDKTLELTGVRDTNEADYKKRMLELTGVRDAADTAYKQRTLDLQALRDAGTITSDQWRKEQGLLNIDAQNRNTEAARSAGLLQAGTGLAGTALGIWGKEEWQPDGTKSSVLSRNAGKAFDAVSDLGTGIKKYLTGTPTSRQDKYNGSTDFEWQSGDRNAISPGYEPATTDIKSIDQFNIDDLMSDTKVYDQNDYGSNDWGY